MTSLSTTDRPPAPPGSATGRPMRVLLVTAGDPDRFRRLGGGTDSSYPKHELAYPYYGLLLEQGLEVNITTMRYRDLRSVHKVARSLRHYDAAFCWSLEGPALALAALPLRQSRKVHTVVYANDPPRSNPLAGMLRQAGFKAGLRAGGIAIYVTNEQAREAHRDMGLPTMRRAYLQVGTDIDFFAPWPAHSESLVRPEVRRLAEERYVVAGGDQQRDEGLIAKVLSGLGVKLVRLTQEPSIQRHWDAWAQRDKLDVFCMARLSFPEIRFVYQRAMCVLNLVENSWQPAGLTTAKEALACGAPLIMNSGLTTRELKAHLKPSEKIPLMELASRTDWGEARDAVKTLQADPDRARALGAAGRRLVEERLNISRRASELFYILKSYALLSE